MKTMKKVLFIALLCTAATFGQARSKNPKIINRTAGSITFVVDENLPAPKRFIYTVSGDQRAQAILTDNDTPVLRDTLKVVANSFAADSLCSYGLWKSAVNAYADHRPLVLTPDVVWVVISQGFARYVNEHAEEMRSLLVSHEGKMDLVVQSSHDLLSPCADWTQLTTDFTALIKKYTKDGIADVITSDFSTSGVNEQIASRVTLMESMKSYFKYIAIYVSCGIPNITLKGTPDDWRKVLKKTKQLKKYGLTAWVSELEPILAEFVSAAEGQPRQAFWQGIVKKKRVDNLKGGGCSPDKPTEMDGWLLKFFPDKDGKTYDEFPHTWSLTSEMVRTEMKYQQVNPVDGTVTKETSLLLWAGIVGAEVDADSGALMPKVGWFVNVPKNDDEILEEMKKKDENWGSIDISVQEVPEVLSRLKHIKRLSLSFTGKVVLPEWMDDMVIDDFEISGKMTEEEKAAILRRFPKADVYVRK